jgi:hypothetical protein
VSRVAKIPATQELAVELGQSGKALIWGRTAEKSKSFSDNLDTNKQRPKVLGYVDTALSEIATALKIR